MSTDKTQQTTDSSVTRLERMQKSIRKILKDLNISAREASRRAGFKNVGYVGDILEGRSKNPDLGRIIELADGLGVPLAELTGESDPTPLAHLLEPSAPSDSLVPRYAARIAINDHWVSVEWKPLDSVHTLPNHPASDGVYAVAVFNDLNAPRYFLGETVLVSPVSPIKVGDFVFVRTREGRCSIGRLASVDAESATWELMSNGESVSADMTDLEAFHRIVGTAV